MKYIFAGLIIILSGSCQQKHEKVYRSFYFWKTTMVFSEAENTKLQSLHIEKIYTRFFDVDYNNKPVTSGIINIRKLPCNVSLIPVVYITNNTLRNTIETDELADHICALIKKILYAQSVNVYEIQMDCDWTLETKEKYFTLLKKIQHHFPGKVLSCTIRLHQVKYSEKTGIPPVQRGMLMFYNMGDLKNNLTNSIYNEKDAKKYVTYIKKYPLALDVALPLFSWIKQYRFGKLTGLISQISPEELSKNENFREEPKGNYSVIKNIILHGEFFQAGDKLVPEEISAETAVKAAKLVNKYLTTDTCSVILYHWNPVNKNQHDNSSIEEIYSVFQ